MNRSTLAYLTCALLTLSLVAPTVYADGESEPAEKVAPAPQPSTSIRAVEPEAASEGLRPAPLPAGVLLKEEVAPPPVRRKPAKDPKFVNQIVQLHLIADLKDHLTDVRRGIEVILGKRGSYKLHGDSALIVSGTADMQKKVAAWLEAVRDERVPEPLRVKEVNGAIVERLAPATEAEWEVMAAKGAAKASAHIYDVSDLKEQLDAILPKVREQVGKSGQVTVHHNRMLIVRAPDDAQKRVGALLGEIRKKLAADKIILVDGERVGDAFAKDERGESEPLAVKVVRPQRLRSFDVADLLKRDPKIDERVRRLLPDASTVKLHKNVLIIRSEPVHLSRVDRLLDEIRKDDGRSQFSAETRAGVAKKGSTLSRLMKKKTSLDMRDATMAEVASVIQTVTGTPVVVGGKLAKAKVNVKVKDMPIPTVIRMAAAQAGGYAVFRDKDVMIMPAKGVMRVQPPVAPVKPRPLPKEVGKIEGDRQKQQDRLRQFRNALETLAAEISEASAAGRVDAARAAELRLKALVKEIAAAEAKLDVLEKERSKARNMSKNFTLKPLEKKRSDLLVKEMSAKRAAHEATLQELRSEIAHASHGYEFSKKAGDADRAEMFAHKRKSLLDAFARNEQAVRDLTKKIHALDPAATSKRPVPTPVFMARNAEDVRKHEALKAGYRDAIKQLEVQIERVAKDLEVAKKKGQSRKAIAMERVFKDLQNELSLQRRRLSDLELATSKSTWRMVPSTRVSKGEARLGGKAPRHPGPRPPTKAEMSNANVAINMRHVKLQALQERLAVLAAKFDHARTTAAKRELDQERAAITAEMQKLKAEIELIRKFPTKSIEFGRNNKPKVRLTVPPNLETIREKARPEWTSRWVAGSQMDVDRRMAEVERSLKGYRTAMRYLSGSEQTIVRSRMVSLEKELAKLKAVKADQEAASRRRPVGATRAEPSNQQVLEAVRALSRDVRSLRTEVRNLTKLIEKSLK